MKVFIYVLMVLAALLVAYNITVVDFSDPFKDDSLVAMITIISGLCAILLLVILVMSRKIARLNKRK